MTSEQYWRQVLLAGGSTRLPAWSHDAEPGVAEQQVDIPFALWRHLRRHSKASGIPMSAMWLAVHAKVLATLTGEADVCLGYAAGDCAAGLPLQIATGVPSWRDLVAEAERAECDLIAHRVYPLSALRAQLGVPGPSYDTVAAPLIDPADAAPDDSSGGQLTDDLPDGVALAIAVEPRWAGAVLRLRYRTDAVSYGYANRIAGYHVTALGLLLGDPEAAHAGQSLLSDHERTFQVEAMTGPSRELPDRRVHELFEAHVRQHPHAVAALHRDEQWTYQQLNARANHLAHALRARGLHREGIVAVVTERNLNWMASVLAVFKAGGAYLPIEPHFPADRIATTLSRAGCGFVLTEDGATATLDEALRTLVGVQRIEIETLYAERHLETDLDLLVSADQLAYIYFTSGSTGTPKGAMCEQAGMLNHMLAKIEDLDITAESVVAQTAPQCFDISLWQLIAPVLAGGRTLIVGQETVLDVEQFITTVADARVSVLQLVPSYLKAVLSYLERRPVPLPHLRYASATGEALKKEHTQRWFAALPQVRLVNAFGLTETSDDTNHEVMESVPAQDRVPLGRPVANIREYLLDEHLHLVPLGSPGLIAYSGVCVGRGYVNDPVRTAQTYLKDPFVPGQRLYLGGDYGRWLPDGKLEFLGRRDNQVKIAGFRIELGEVENALLGTPQIRDGAVIVADHTEGGSQLVAFYSATQPLAVEEIREHLARSLPEYMVPRTIHWSPRLPLNGNGKVDRKALTALAAEAASGATRRSRGEPPRSPAEQQLAVAWAQVLGLPAAQIRREDHFFDLGGTSLLAVKLAIALNRVLALPDLTAHPVLADQAALIDSRSSAPTPLGTARPA